MPSYLVLSFGLLFSSVAVAIDLQRSARISAAIWLPTVWFMLSSSKSLSEWVSPHAYSEFDMVLEAAGSPLDRTVVAVLMACALLVVLRRRDRWSHLLKPNVWLWVFIALMAVSIIWSGHRLVASRRWLKGWGTIWMALVVLSERDPLEAIGAVVRRSGYILMPLSLVLVKYFRAYGVEYTPDGLAEMWLGVTSQKNSLGILSCVVAAYLVTELVRGPRGTKRSFERFIQVGMLALCVYLLLGPGPTMSATSVGALALALLVIGLSIFQRSMRLRANFFHFLVVLLAAGVLLSSTLLESLVAMAGRDMTLTGRTFIWAELLRIGARHPILGVGYGSLWLGDVGYELWTRFGVRQGHNGYIETYVELGILGLCLLGFMMIHVYRNIFRSMDVDRDYGMVRLVYFLMVLVQNGTESSLASPTSMMWFMFLVVALEPSKFSNDRSDLVTQGL
jgi:exopolysaccharide production protein ExoQ